VGNLPKLVGYPPDGDGGVTPAELLRGEGREAALVDHGVLDWGQLSKSAWERVVLTEAGQEPEFLVVSVLLKRSVGVSRSQDRSWSIEDVTAEALERIVGAWYWDIDLKCSRGPIGRGLKRTEAGRGKMKLKIFKHREILTGRATSWCWLLKN